ncbi:hypothetical protein Tco_0787802 [Tanacetum coccineum]
MPKIILSPWESLLPKHLRTHDPSKPGVSSHKTSSSNIPYRKATFDIHLDYRLATIGIGVTDSGRTAVPTVGLEKKLKVDSSSKTFHISVKEPYNPNCDPPGIIYQDKSKKKRLMQADEIHKFCDGTLQSVRKILRESLLNFKFGYTKGMPLREWTEKDKKCTGIMVNKIDDLVLKRRIMRSLEVLVGGRKTKMDKRLLQRTV